MIRFYHCLAIIALLVNLIATASAQQKHIKYTVRKGDSLYTIAHKHNLRLGDVLRANNLRDPHEIKPGLTLRIPVKSSASQTRSQAPSRPVSSVSGVSSGWASVNKDRINIRRAPNTEAERMEIVDRWTKVKVLSNQGEWSRVQFDNGRIGWIKSQYLAKSAAPVQAAAKPPVQKKQAAKPAVTAQKKPVVTAQKKPSKPVDKEVVATSATEVKKAAAPLRATLPVDEENEEGEERAGTLYSRDPRLSRPTGASTPASGTKTAVSRETSRNSGLIRMALSYRGAPYRYGASNGRSFDCSGFTSYIYRKQGISLPHNAAAQFQRGRSVAKSHLQAGDLVFFRTRGRRISHVGIYIGNSQFVHASSGGGRVRVDTIASGYYQKRYAGARRVK